MISTQANTKIIWLGLYLDQVKIWLTHDIYIVVKMKAVETYFFYLQYITVKMTRDVILHMLTDLDLSILHFWNYLHF